MHRVPRGLLLVRHALVVSVQRVMQSDAASARRTEQSENEIMLCLDPHFSDTYSHSNHC